MFTPSGYKDIGIRKFEFVAKAQFLSNILKTSQSAIFLVALFFDIFEKNITKNSRNSLS